MALKSVPSKAIEVEALNGGYDEVVDRSVTLNAAGGKLVEVLEGIHGSLLGVHILVKNGAEADTK